MRKYKHIDWIDKKLPTEVTKHRLWGFHQAILSMDPDNHDLLNKQYWALASIQSLIEIDINREFVIDAGLAFEDDVEKGVYQLDEATGFFVTKLSTGQFTVYRLATSPNGRFGDVNKGDVLRTSKMEVSLYSEDFVSYHPSLSYPTQGLPRDKRRANKAAQIDEFYKNLLSIYQRIRALPNIDHQQDCLFTFCSNVKTDGIGCANERLDGAITNTVQVLIQYETKVLSDYSYNNLVQQISGKLDSDDVGEAFNNIVVRYDGFAMSDGFIINQENKRALAEKFISYAESLYILDENEHNGNLDKLLNNQPAPIQPLPQENIQDPQLIDALKKKYAHFTTSNKSNRKHGTEANSETLPPPLQHIYKNQRGDYLKSSILKDFYLEVKDATSKEGIDEIEKKYKQDGRYSILASGQDLFTRFFPCNLYGFEKGVLRD